MKPYSYQEIFDKIASHLRKQGRKSKDGGWLIAHAENGDMDPVGVMFSKEELPKHLWRSIPTEDSELRLWMAERIGLEATFLVRRLQDIHDHWGPAVEYGKLRPVDLEAGLKQVAYRFGLKYTEVPS